MRPRRHRGRARRRSEVLSDGARHSGGGSRSALDPGLPRRGDRGHRTCRAARGIDGKCRRLAQGAGPMNDVATKDLTANGAYNVERIRADFPILAMQVYGKPLIYLDNAASAQKPRAVLDRLNEAYTTQYANV